MDFKCSCLECKNNVHILEFTAEVKEQSLIILINMKISCSLFKKQKFFILISNFLYNYYERKHLICYHFNNFIYLILNLHLSLVPEIFTRLFF